MVVCALRLVRVQVWGGVKNCDISVSKKDLFQAITQIHSEEHFHNKLDHYYYYDCSGLSSIKKPLELGGDPIEFNIYIFFSLFFLILSFINAPINCQIWPPITFMKTHQILRTDKNLSKIWSCKEFWVCSKAPHGPFLVAGRQLDCLSDSESNARQGPLKLDRSKGRDETN